MNPEEKNVQNENTTETTGKAPTEHNPIKSLRTYQGDVEEAVVKNKYTTTSIFLAEQGKQNSKLFDFGVPKDSGARNKFFILLGSTLLILGMLTIGAMFYVKSEDAIVIEKTTKALISFSQEKTMAFASTTREKFVNDILTEKKNFNLPVNSVLYINTVDSFGNPEKVLDVMSLVAPQMPAALIRSFAQEYMFGIYSFDTNEPFIILTTEDFASSFSGMLQWEKSVVSDFGKLFSIKQNASSTIGQFKDLSLRNKDLRILYGENGKALILYSFIDKSTLIITTNENILNALIGKYNISKQIR